MCVCVYIHTHRISSLEPAVEFDTVTRDGLAPRNILLPLAAALQLPARRNVLLNGTGW
jgi:hypothetical protein